MLPKLNHGLLGYPRRDSEKGTDYILSSSPSLQFVSKFSASIKACENGSAFETSNKSFGSNHLFWPARL
jgi:hypothetical protein